jgi:hypothetical protein
VIHRFGDVLGFEVEGTACVVFDRKTHEPFLTCYATLGRPRRPRIDARRVAPPGRASEISTCSPRILRTLSSTSLKVRRR